jgi:hypothetical protein
MLKAEGDEGETNFIPVYMQVIEVEEATLRLEYSARHRSFFTVSPCVGNGIVLWPSYKVEYTWPFMT